MENTDVIIISSSRPKLLPYLIKSFQQKVHFDGNFRVLLHEDFVYPNESKKVVEYTKDKNFIDEVYEDNPPIGIGASIGKMLKQVKSKYLIMLQDDGEFEIPIDFGQVIGTMEKNPSINCVYLNKRKNLGMINGFKFEEYRFNHSLFLLHYHGPLGPGIGRTDFVKKRGEIAPSNKAQEGGGNNIIKGGGKFDKETLESVGCYIYGPLKFPRITRHLGSTGATKPHGKWGRNKDGYGGDIEGEYKTPSVQSRAPGLQETPERPLYLQNKQNQIKDLKKKGIIPENENCNSNKKK